MSLSQSDLVFVLSGGVINDSPKKSLGGYPSPIPITNELQNLFATLEPREASDGKTDYRCFYIFNDNPTDSFYNMQVWTEKIDENVGALIEMGLNTQNEVQRLTFSTPDLSASGTFRLKLDNQLTSTIDFNQNSTTLAANIQAALVSLDNLQDSVVTNSDLNEYTINFNEASGNRIMPLILVQDNIIIPSLSILPSRIYAGSPINTIATLVNDESTTPTGITFVLGVKPGILVGTLRSGEGFPLWVKRTINSGTGELNADGFILHCKVTSSL